MLPKPWCFWKLPRPTNWAGHRQSSWGHCIQFTCVVKPTWWRITARPLPPSSRSSSTTRRHGQLSPGRAGPLGLARAYALSGDAAKSRTAYQEFFALWKDADPDIPILKEAKAEYAKLQ